MGMQSSSHSHNALLSSSHPRPPSCYLRMEGEGMCLIPDLPFPSPLSLQLRSSAASSQGLLPFRSSPVPPQLLGSRPCPHMYHFCLHLCPPSQHVPVEHPGDLTGRASQTPSIIQSTPSMLDSVLSPIEPSQLPQGWYCYLLIQQTRGQKLREGEPACGGLQD